MNTMCVLSPFVPGGTLVKALAIDVYGTPVAVTDNE
ncbi:hypothetical protein CHUV2995_03217 [Corynebacterium diphtheriae subsp. lausannense]|uniref:Uncharacterized protein n=1 Tax=Corynebacterium diphtheriae TaxID=1717 RepID=A0A811FZW1_CORDP|nr:hypothetical protein B11Q_02458 [Corynebacterium diphtheriae]SNW32820.1 hypothetical protein FRC0043_02431 [Corynebacterium belfantii]SPJ42379.1 hypothetical protein CHUV2995_03217 [Corynebacterium diphtheriae subsp. lausannense]WJY88576.1 hypothetical protein CDIPH_11630 [Corynebacterium diphtheriae]CAB0486757.1 hypothetical protein CIP101352_00078 [Corynebacterium diphtheriae]